MLVVCTLLVTDYQLAGIRTMGPLACLCCVALTTLDVTPTLFRTLFVLLELFSFWHGIFLSTLNIYTYIYIYDKQLITV